MSSSSTEKNTGDESAGAHCAFLDIAADLANTARPMVEPKTSEFMETLVSLCKRRGFIFQSSEIYGGLNGFWDYGPLGAELKRNIKDYWWRSMTQLREGVVGLDASIIMHPRVWEASGHTSTFSDLMVDCLLTQKRFRADQIEPQSGTAYFYTGATDAAAGKESKDPFSALIDSGKHPEYARKVARQFYQQRGLKEPALQGERFEPVRNTTRYNPDNGSPADRAAPFQPHAQDLRRPRRERGQHLRTCGPRRPRPSSSSSRTCSRSPGRSSPSASAKSARPSATRSTLATSPSAPGNSSRWNSSSSSGPTKPSRPFAGAWPSRPGRATPASPSPIGAGNSGTNTGSRSASASMRASACLDASLVEYWQKPEELAHYARATVDVLYKFPFGKRGQNGELIGEELEGIAARSDFDLSQHQRFAARPMTVFDEELKAAWPKLDRAKQAELSERFFQHRLKYLLKVGETPGPAEKQARAGRRSPRQRRLHPPRHRALRRRSPPGAGPDLQCLLPGPGPRETAPLRAQVVLARAAA